MKSPPRKSILSGMNRAHRSVEVAKPESVWQKPTLSPFAMRAIAREAKRGTPQGEILRSRFTTMAGTERRPTLGEVRRAIGAGNA